MNRFLLSFIVGFFFIQLASAQIGIGTEFPNQSTILDVFSSDRGILIPRVPLESTRDLATIRYGNVNSMLVFNTQEMNDVTPGYYYWYETRWYRLASTADGFEEIITTLIDIGEGKFEYTSEDGTQTLIDIPAKVLEDILNEGEIYLKIINLIGDAETMTILEDHGNGTYTYYNETEIDADGLIIGSGTNINVVDDVVMSILNEGEIYDQIINLIDIQTDVFIDNGDGTFTHTSVDGQTLVFDANTTTFTNNNDGTYTFTNDNGDSMTINAMETLTFLALNADGKTLEYTDENGYVTTIDFEVIVQNLETITTIIDNNDGTFTYTDEIGGETILDLSNLETLTSIALNPDNIHIDYTDENGIITSLNLTELIRNLQATVTLVDGINTTVESVVADNNIEYRVNVSTAEGTNLGVVKESGDNATISINEDGELAVNLENLNSVVHTNIDYIALWTDVIILGDASNEDINILLPNPTLNTKGKKYTIKKIDTNETNYIYVIGNIAGANGQNLYTAIPYTGWEMISDGTVWHIVNSF